MNIKEKHPLLMKSVIVSCAGSLLLQLAAPALAVDLSLPDPVGYTKRIVSDTIELPSHMAHWTPGQRWTAGGVVAATGLSLWLVDENIRDFNETHRNEFWRNVSWSSTHYGDYKYQVPIIGGLWLGGRLLESPVLAKTAADAGEASVIAALIINPTLCFITGRALPSAHEDASKFVPLRLGRYSFPSGHTSAAFALASVLDIDLRPVFGYYHTPVVYGLALGVAHSRMYDAKHYLSEVILGGAIGWAVGTWIASKDRGPGGVAGKTVKEPAVSFAPSLNGLTASVKF